MQDTETESVEEHEHGIEAAEEIHKPKQPDPEEPPASDAAKLTNMKRLAGLGLVVVGAILLFN